MIRLQKVLALTVFALAFACGVAAAADRHVIVINDTAQKLIELYASNVGTDDWEEDILGRSMVEPGGQIRANIYDGSDYCHYDLKAVFSNGQSVIRRRLDVCVIETWTIHDEE